MKRTLAGIVACLVVFTACRQETPDITFNTQAVDTSPVETSISYITDNAEGWLNAHTTAPPETEPEITETESEITDEELVSDAVKDGLSALSKKDRNAVYNAIDMDVLYYSEYGDMASVITDDFISSLGLDVSEEYEIADIAPIDSEQYADMKDLLDAIPLAVAEETNTAETVNKPTGDAEDNQVQENEAFENETSIEFSVETSISSEEAGSEETSDEETKTSISETQVPVPDEPKLPDIPEFSSLKEQFGITDVYCATVNAIVKVPVETTETLNDTLPEETDTENSSEVFQISETSIETSVTTETEERTVSEDTSDISSESESAVTDAETELKREFTEVTVIKKFYVFKINNVWKLDILYSYIYDQSIKAKENEAATVTEIVSETAIVFDTTESIADTEGLVETSEE